MKRMQNLCRLQSGELSREMKTAFMITAAVIGLMLVTNHTMAQTAPTPRVPIEIAPYTHGVAFSNMTFYLNATDSHYHWKGWLKTHYESVWTLSMYS